VRLALLEADVHVGVAQALLAAVREQALGEEVLKSLTPGQQVVKIVRDELARLLGAGEGHALSFASRPPSVLLLVGLQGSGKTTTTAKLGRWLKSSGRYPFLVPADVQRPAAIEQLVRVARQPVSRCSSTTARPVRSRSRARDSPARGARASTPCSSTPRVGCTSTMT
jgi:signal recognition particle subunit SRP54